MHHVRKEKWLGCAVAAAAMLTDTNYDEVADHWPDLDEANLCTAQRISLDPGKLDRNRLEPFRPSVPVSASPQVFLSGLARCRLYP